MSAFNAPRGYQVGNSPSGTATGDLNGDGRLDIVVVNSNFSKMTVLLNTGAGIFSSHDVVTPVGLWDVALADFNGDGKLDAVTANGGSATASFFAGNGAGGFAAATSVPSVLSSVIAVGDFNGDGKRDFAVNNQAGVAPYFGNGSGGFAKGTDVTIANVRDLVVSDLNGDAKLDLIVATFDNISVALGNGNGTFGVPTPFASGGSAIGVAVRDLNHDAKPDIAAVNSGSTFSNVSILTGDGAGGFSAPVNFNGGIAFGERIESGDLDGDGNFDLAVGDAFGRVNAIFGDGTGSFGAAREVGQLPTVDSLAVADFNGDGLHDVAAAGSDSFVPGQLVVFPSAGAAGFGLKSVLTGVLPVSLATADFNRDGRMDFAVATAPNFSPSLNLSLYLANAAGGFTQSAGQVMTGLLFIAAGDFNGDGNPDVAGTVGQQNKVVVYLGNGTGGLAAAISTSVGERPLSLAAGDLNNDGKLDLVVANQTSATLSILLGAGNGTFTAATSLITASAPFGLTLGDFTGDGVVDIASTASNGLVVFPGNGNGAFAAPLGPHSGVLGSIVTADFNADGFADIASLARIVLGNNAGGFNVGIPLPAGGQRNALTAADFDSDGYMDLAIADLGNDLVTVLYGNGAGGVSRRDDFAGGNNPWDVAAADLNGDGVPELLTAFGASNTVGIFTNVCPVADVSLTIADTPDPVNEGAGFSYTVSVHNQGPSPATDLIVNVTLPASVGLVSATPDQGTCSGAHCELGDLAAGATLGVVINVTAPATPGLLTASASVAARERDLNSGNNSASAVTRVADLRAPQTTITEGPAAIVRVRNVTVSFASDEANSTFVCSLDGAAAIGCSTPVTYQNLADGNHTFSVAAIDPAGNVDATPATAAWLVQVTIDTTTAVQVSPTAPVFGQPLTLSAIVSPVASTATPTGVVRFTIDGAAVGGALTLSGGAASVAGPMLNAGTHTIVAAYEGEGQFNPSSGTLTQIVDKASQTIDFAALPNKTYGDADFLVTATASSQLPVTFVATGNCLITGSTVRLIGAGACTITATQGGTSNYHPAPAVARSFTILKATLTVTADDVTKLLGAALPAFTASYSGFKNGETLTTSGVTGSPSFTTAATAASSVGTYAITPALGTLASANYQFQFVNGTLTVTFNICALYDTSRLNARGSTVPIKVQLCDANGANVSSPSIVVHATNVVLVSTNVSGTPEDAGNANPDSDFRVVTDESGVSYIFNLLTRGMATGTYDLLFVASGDPVTHRARLQIR